MRSPELLKKTQFASAAAPPLLTSVPQLKSPLAQRSLSTLVLHVERLAPENLLAIVTPPLASMVRAAVLDVANVLGLDVAR